MVKDGNDDTLWDRVTQDVKPLKSRDRAAQSIKTPDPVKPERPAAPKAPEPVTPSRISASPDQQWRQAAPIEIGNSAGVDKRTAERLRRGKMAIDGRIDLHGMTQARAHEALNRTIDGAHADGKRCILVITGKGQGILKRAVPLWLSDPYLRVKILTVATARPNHGGDGALYVLLKRLRT